MNLFWRKSIEQLRADAASGNLRRALGPVQLTTLGVGAIIGAGIFVLTGQAAGASDVAEMNPVWFLLRVGTRGALFHARRAYESAWRRGLSTSVEGGAAVDEKVTLCQHKI